MRPPVVSMSEHSQPGAGSQAHSNDRHEEAWHAQNTVTFHRLIASVKHETPDFVSARDAPLLPKGAVQGWHAQFILPMSSAAIAGTSVELSLGGSTRSSCCM